MREIPEKIKNEIQNVLNNIESNDYGYYDGAMPNPEHIDFYTEHLNRLQSQGSELADAFKDVVDYMAEKAVKITDIPENIKTEIDNILEDIELEGYYDGPVPNPVNLDFYKVYLKKLEKEKSELAEVFGWVVESMQSSKIPENIPESSSLSWQKSAEEILDDIESGKSNSVSPVEFEIIGSKITGIIIDKLANNKELSKVELSIIAERFYHDKAEGIAPSLKKIVNDHINEQYPDRQSEILSKLSQTASTIISTYINENSEKCFSKMVTGARLDGEDINFIEHNHLHFTNFVKDVETNLLKGISEVQAVETSSAIAPDFSNETTLQVINKLIEKKELTKEEIKYLQTYKNEVESAIHMQVESMVARADTILQNSWKKEAITEQQEFEAENSEVDVNEWEIGDEIEFDEVEADFLQGIKDKALQEIEKRNTGQYNEEVYQLKILAPESL